MGKWKTEYSIRFFLCCIYLLFPELLFSGHPLISDDVYTIGKKKFQIEFTPEFLFYSKERFFEFPFTITFGMFHNADFVIGIPYYVHHVFNKENEGKSDFDNPVLEFKWNIYQGKKVKLGVKPGIVIDKQKPLQFNTVNQTFFLLQTVEQKDFLFHFNEGIIFITEQNNYTRQFHFSIAGEKQISKYWNAVMNIVFEGQNPSQMIRTLPHFVLGIQFFPNEMWMLDIGYDASLGRPFHTPCILTGITFLK
jgi:hypothetical protein